MQVATKVSAPDPTKQFHTETPSGKENGEPPTPSSGEVEEQNGRENQVVHAKSISIKDVLKGVSREIPVIDEEIDEIDQVVKEASTSEPTREISENLIQQAWEEYAMLMEKSHPRVYSTLKQHKPTLTESGRILINLISNAQRENFNQNIKPGLTHYFQEHIADIDYLFETNLLENETTVRKMYTDSDKLDFMIGKNSNLEKFKTRFKLDFDN